MDNFTSVSPLPRPLSWALTHSVLIITRMYYIFDDCDTALEVDADGSYFSRVYCCWLEVWSDPTPVYLLPAGRTFLKRKCATT